jgi:hypothetical protein
MRSKPIADIYKEFPKEWLLIEVLRRDPQTNTTTVGKVLAHSPNRDTIYKKLLTVKSKFPTLVDYSSHKLPKDVAVIFIAYA